MATESPNLDGASIEPPLALLAQTTAEPTDFRRFAETVRSRFDAGAVVNDTACSETVRRYRVARELAERVDAMVVVGSRTSANTNRLAEACRAAGASTFLVASPGEIAGLEFARFGSIGLTAGASTPDTVIDEIDQQLKTR